MINAVLYDNTPNGRELAAAGVGIRTSGKLPNTQVVNTTDVAMGWAKHGGDPQSDATARSPRIWLTTSFRF